MSCREGEQVSIDQALVECPLASIVALRSDPDNISNVNTIPPTCKYGLRQMLFYNSLYVHTVCHQTCSSCQTIGDSSQCLSCHSGFDLFSTPPSACNVSVEFGSGSGDGPLGKPSFSMVLHISTVSLQLLCPWSPTD